MLTNDDTHELFIDIKNPISFSFNITVTAYHHNSSSISFKPKYHPVRNITCDPYGFYNETISKSINCSDAKVNSIY